MDLREVIPGYSEELDAESRARDLPFLGISDRIGPFYVRHMTVRDYLLLKRTPLLQEKTPTPGDLVAFIRFLWVGYKNRFSLSGWLFARRCKRYIDQGHYDEIYQACLNYLEDTFIDCISEKPLGWNPPYYSEAVGFIGSFSRNHGWSEEKTLAMPLKLAVQYKREIEHAGGIQPSNRSDRMIVAHTLAMRRN